MANAKMLCQDGRDRWDHEKKWDGMTDPDKLGCINAMQLIYNPDEPAVTRNAKISKLQDIVCKSVRSK